MIKNFLNKLYEHLFHSGIRKQIMRIVIPSLLLPTITIGFFLTYTLVKTSYEQAHSQMTTENLRVRSLLVDCFIDINSMSEEIISDKVLRTLLNADYLNVTNVPFYLDSYTPISNYHDSKSFISDITIYSMNNTLKDGRYIKKATPEVIDNYFSLISYPADVHWVSTKKNSDNEVTSSELTLVRSIPALDENKSAILVISISNNYLKNRIKNNTLYTSLQVNDEPLFFSTTRSDQGLKQFIPIEPIVSKDFIIKKDNQKVCGHLSSLIIPKSNDILYIGTLDQHIIHTITKLLILCFCIIAFSFCVALMSVFIYTKALGRRIEILKTATHQASIGNYNIIETFEGEDELTDTFRDIKQMIQTVQQTEAKIYEEQLRKQQYENQQREMEFKLLTSQINPHFMYNTLETIRMMALSNGDRQVSNTVSLFGKSLHYVLENTISTKASIEKELKHIVTYLQIQKLRFDERFDYCITQPPELDTSAYQILPLLLQPLVENAIVHGIEEIDHKCMIQINLSLKDEENLVIDVIDDGMGMSDEALNQLNEHLLSDKSESHSSIALSNIAQRIRLFYGEGYYLKIMHHKPSGTHVQLSIPLIPYE